MLYLHLNRSPHFQLHIIPPLHKAQGNSLRRSSSSPNPCPIQRTGSQTSRRSPTKSSVNAALGRIFNLLPSIFVLLNRSFRIFHRFVVRPRRVLHRPRQHHGISAGINHRSKVHQDFSPTVPVSRPLHMRNRSLNVGSSRNHHAVAHDKRKRRLRVNRITLARIQIGRASCRERV